MQKQKSSAEPNFRGFQTSSFRQRSMGSADRTLNSIKNGEKQLKEEILQHCIRVWNKEKRSKNKTYAIRILNFTSKTPKNKVVRPQCAVWTKAQFGCSPPVVNLFYSHQLLDQPHTYSDFKPKHLSNNTFRVKLAAHHKSKSTPEKIAPHNEVDELNINFKAVTQIVQSPNKTIDFPVRKNSKISQFYRVRLKKKQIRAIKVDEQPIQNDFILSPW